MSKSLEGIRLVDFSRWITGKSYTCLPSDQGTEVIKVENSGDYDDKTFTPFPNDTNTRFMLLCKRGK